ncbi:hypothetical protein AcW2_001256 [Taiwanofungus camphoratus]|nr:hypothetical protein AcW2_001256 [Antrodia cinnamomea]
MLLVALILTFVFMSRPHALLTSAILVNHTIDDYFPDSMTGARFAYTPAGAWNAGQRYANCTACLDPAQVFDQTWHDSTFNNQTEVFTEPATAEVDFNGTALYVFCILDQSGLRGSSNMAFMVDNEVVGAFVQEPNGADTFDYHYLVYSNESLSSGMHTFALQNGGMGGPYSLALFDYIIYTLDDGQMPFQKGPDHNASRTFTPPSSTSSSTQPSSSSANKTHGLSAKDTAAVVAVSTAVGTLMMTLLVWLSCRKCRRHSRYHPCARGFFCSAPSPHIEENPRSSGWTRDTWRCDYRLYQSLSKHWHALAGPPSRGSMRHVHTPSAVSSADGALLANESKTEDLQVATLEAPSTRGAQVPQLVLTIPSWSGCSLEEERPPTPPPKPLRTPRTPPTPSNRPDPSRKSECTLGDSGRDRDETATHTSTLTTPTAYYPSGCFLPAPRSLDLPARADSVTTIPLVPNRHADMADAGPAVVTVSLEDAADVRAAGGEGLGKEVFARIGAMWHASRPPSLHGSPADG